MIEFLLFLKASTCQCSLPLVVLVVVVKEQVVSFQVLLHVIWSLKKVCYSLISNIF